MKYFLLHIKKAIRRCDTVEETKEERRENPVLYTLPLKETLGRECSNQRTLNGSPHSNKGLKNFSFPCVLKMI